MRREDNATGHPCRESPRLHVIGRQGKNPAYEKVRDAAAYRRGNPCLS
jgi:hypothetical protein